MGDTHYGTPDHGPLNGKTGRQLWEQYRLAIGGRLAPADADAQPRIFGAASWEQRIVRIARRVGAKYGILWRESLRDAFRPADPRRRTLYPRYIYDPIFVDPPPKGYVAKVRIDGKEYQSGPTDLVP